MKYDLNNLSRKKALEWNLVLSAMNIPHRLKVDGNRASIEVEEGFENEAEAQVGLYEEENSREEIKIGAFSHAAGPSPLIPVLAVFTSLFLFQTILYRTSSYDLWLKSGDSSNIDIRNGEYWRVFTALTLHAGLAHFLSNAFMGGVVFYNLFTAFGSGPGLFLAAIAGASGNLAAAYIIPVEYHSIGASGAVFGAFGILAADRMIRRGTKRKKPDWKPAAAALVFLGLFGTAGGSDIIGHLLSLVSGFLIGIAAGSFLGPDKYPGLRVRISFALLSVFLIAGSWIRALK
jgi:membrane associated rhomboid family serine protease